MMNKTRGTHTTKGSCFDSPLEAGSSGHIQATDSGDVDVAAFSSRKVSARKMPGQKRADAPKPRRVRKGPPSASSTKQRTNPANTEFRRFYDRGDLPIQIDHKGVNNKLSWKVEVDKLDYHHYLPIFFDGLREQEEPYSFLAHRGVLDMIEKNKIYDDSNSCKILPVVPQLIIPVKTALNTRDPIIMTRVIKVLAKMIESKVQREHYTPQTSNIGLALVPYYRQILPVLNIFLAKNANVGDQICYDQKAQNNLGDNILSLLHVMEDHGGEDAFINIKYLIPTYQSTHT